jgi:hypothetical protein
MSQTARLRAQWAAAQRLAWACMGLALLAAFALLALYVRYGREECDEPLAGFLLASAGASLFSGILACGVCFLSGFDALLVLRAVTRQLGAAAFVWAALAAAWLAIGTRWVWRAAASDCALPLILAAASYVAYAYVAAAGVCCVCLGWWCENRHVEGLTRERLLDILASDPVAARRERGLYQSQRAAAAAGDGLGLFRRGDSVEEMGALARASFGDDDDDEDDA